MVRFPIRPDSVNTSVLVLSVLEGDGDQIPDGPA